jgi:hypothetical protein
MRNRLLVLAVAAAAISSAAHAAETKLEWPFCVNNGCATNFHNHIDDEVLLSSAEFAEMNRLNERAWNLMDRALTRRDGEIAARLEAAKEADEREEARLSQCKVRFLRIGCP